MAATCTVCELHTESTFSVEGMHCREEVALIEKRFTSLAGVEAFSADILARRLHVTHDAARLTTSAIAAAVADAGMRAWLEHEPVTAPRPLAAAASWPVITAATLLAAAVVRSWIGGPDAGVAACAFAAIALALPGPLRKAWHALRLRALDINVLMAVAVAGALALGDWLEAAAVVVLFAVAQRLEAGTMDRARRAVGRLLDLAPATVLIRDTDGEREVPADSVVPGARVVVRPGERVALDGRIEAGRTAVNQAPVTGESLPVDKAPGDLVYAGSINGAGAIELTITHSRRDSTLARIVHLVERAQAQRAPTQTVVDRFAAVYTPAVLGLAMLIAVAPAVLVGAAWSPWVYRALVLLVVACPCALVISTPVSIVAALAAAARQGVLIKGGAHLERIGQVQCVAFDKTGTLTEGRPDVVDVVPMGGAERRAVLASAAAIEHRSEHPIARSIVRRAADEGVGDLRAASVTALIGGAEGEAGGVAVVVGNHRLFEERGLCSDELHGRLAEVASSGRTPVLVARGGQPIGICAVADRPRAAGREVVQALRQQGVRAIVMLTGDGEGTARAVGAAVGVDQCHAELTPGAKADLVQTLQQTYGAVAMIGDGINDAPALATADVGVAMGAIGSDAAIESADIALMSDELMKLPFVVRLSRATVRNIQWNLAIALGLKAAFLVATVAGAATLWMAIVADTGATLLVVANALRLLRTE